MNILQFNVRLAEGGAAGVALDLHQRALQKGLQSRFIYGYGKGGKKSVSHDRYPQVVKHTPRLTSVANIALFRLFNRDLFGNLNSLYRTVTRTAGPVVLHFHVLHSYWLKLEEVVAFCEKVQAHKPDTTFVWTLHDHWSVTGRCAFTDGCEGWKENCQKCPTLGNYPPVKVDRAHQLALVGFEPVVHHVCPVERGKFAKGVKLDFFAQRHNVAHQLLVGLAVVAQVVRNNGNLRFARRFGDRRQFRQYLFRRHVDPVIDDLAAPCPVQAVEGIRHVLAWGNKGAAEREHVAEQLTLALNQLMRTIHLHRRVIVQRRAFLAVIFPAFAAVRKGAAPGHAPVIVQRPDESGIRLMRFYLLTKRHHLFQIQPVAVKNVKMQHHRTGGARHGAV